MSAPDPFLARFQVDPSVALVEPVVAPLLTGPAHHAQFVVELVGPRSLPAQSASTLLGPQWHGALGNPEIFCMAAADTVWRPMPVATQGSYDSVALCWDILSDHGSLNPKSGQHLLQVAEQFAGQIGRRAMPMPAPDDLAKVAKALSKIRDGLDIGISLMVIPSMESVSEYDLWVQCSRLGLRFGPAGSFDWLAAGHPNPLFQVTPIGETESFSLRGVQAGALHQGVTIGFNVPTCPAPATALDGALHAADSISQGIGGALFDQDARPVTPKMRDDMRRDLVSATQVMEEVGLKPGSSAALKLFHRP